MIPNEELLQKAITAAEHLATAGKLNPEQSDKFIDYVVDISVLKGNVRIVRPKAETWEIDKMGVGKRAAVPKTEAQDPGLRRSITTSKVELVPKTIMVPVEIGDEFREINIEGESVEDHIMKMFARQCTNDVEELCLMADVLGQASLESDLKDGGDAAKYVKDTYLALFNGWLRAADGGNIYTAAGANIGGSVFSEAIQKMPYKFRRNRRDLRWLMSSDLYQKWQEKLSGRATALGDQAMGGGGVPTIFGIPPMEVPLLPLYPKVVKHLSLPGTTATSLGYAPIKSGSEVVTAQTLGNVPTTPLIKDTDYTIDYTAGTIARKAGSDPLVVKVTFEAYPQMLLTHMSNLILAIGRDVRIEKDRDIYRGVNQFAITMKVAVGVEEATAIVKATNIGVGV